MFFLGLCHFAKALATMEIGDF
jgi:hypothetical protein